MKLKVLSVVILIVVAIGSAAYSESTAAQAPDPGSKDSISSQTSVDDEDKPIETEKSESSKGNLVNRMRGHHGGLNGLLIPLGAFLMVLGIVAVKQWARVQESRAKLDAIKILAEKGQPVPPEMMVTSNTNSYGRFGRRSPTSRAIIHIGLGIGFLTYFGVTDPHGGLWAIGLGFLFVGIAGFYSAKKLEQK